MKTETYTKYKYRIIKHSLMDTELTPKQKLFIIDILLANNKLEETLLVKIAWLKNRYVSSLIQNLVDKDYLVKTDYGYRFTDNKIEIIKESCDNKQFVGVTNFYKNISAIIDIYTALIERPLTEEQVANKVKKLQPADIIVAISIISHKKGFPIRQSALAKQINVYRNDISKSCKYLVEHHILEIVGKSINPGKRSTMIYGVSQAVTKLILAKSGFKLRLVKQVNDNPRWEDL